MMTRLLRVAGQHALPSIPGAKKALVGSGRQSLQKHQHSSLPDWERISASASPANLNGRLREGSPQRSISPSASAKFPISLLLELISLSKVSTPPSSVFEESASGVAQLQRLNNEIAVRA